MSGTQDQWHFCKKCGVLQWHPAGQAPGPCYPTGQHEPQGFNFTLPFDKPEGPNDKAHWRFCQNCHGLYDETGPKQPCIAGGNHVAAKNGITSANFVLRNGLPEIPSFQGKWFCCGNCSMMSYGPVVGHCIAEKTGEILGHDNINSPEYTLEHSGDFL